MYVKKFKQLVNLEHTFHPFFNIKILQIYNKLDEELYDFKMQFK